MGLAKIQLCACQENKVLPHIGTLVICMVSLLATNANTAAAATTTTTTTTLASEVMPLFLLRWEGPGSYNRS